MGPLICHRWRLVSPPQLPHLLPHNVSLTLPKQKNNLLFHKTRNFTPRLMNRIICPYLYTTRKQREELLGRSKCLLYHNYVQTTLEWPLVNVTLCCLLPVLGWRGLIFIFNGTNNHQYIIGCSLSTAMHTCLKIALGISIKSNAGSLSGQSNQTLQTAITTGPK